LNRGSRPLLVVIAVSVLIPLCWAQSAPQHVRDYIYGPGGRLITTAEPDPYPPTEPDSMGASPGECAIDGIYVSWGYSTDIGSGFSHFNLYRDDVGLIGTFTGYSYTDYSISGGNSYTYEITGVDNAGNESDANTASASMPLCICKSVVPKLCPRVRKQEVSANTDLVPQSVDRLSPILRAARTVHLLTLRPYVPAVASTPAPSQQTIAVPSQPSSPINPGDAKSNNSGQPSPPGTSQDVKHKTGGGGQ
jgi:hypothetical protein